MYVVMIKSEAEHLHFNKAGQYFAVIQDFGSVVRVAPCNPANVYDYYDIAAEDVNTYEWTLEVWKQYCMAL